MKISELYDVILIVILITNMSEEILEYCKYCKMFS